MVMPSIEALATTGVSLLISFLAYSSQYLFYHTEPGPLSQSEAISFNAFVLGIWWCYFLACTVNPGQKGWVDKVGEKDEEDNNEDSVTRKGLRWCKKCNAIKPPRAHHCRKCGRCIPKMDHHCPWTTNCVSHTTFPHFLRFVLYAVVSMSILEYHLFVRAMVIWDGRNLPAYLGPSGYAMSHLLVLLVVNSITLFALTVLLTGAIYSLALNTTTIESWEVERHEALIERARKTGGWVYANGGQRMHVERQEFPYDVSIWRNLCQGMGTRNLFLWLLPFGGGPSILSAGSYEINGFEDATKVWPPPDPEKMPRTARIFEESEKQYGTQIEELAAFKRRQQIDYARWDQHDRAEEDEEDDESVDEYEEGIDGEEGWTNSDGDRLKDFGVDEEAEILTDDDIPLGELLRRRKGKKSKDI